MIFVQKLCKDSQPSNWRRTISGHPSPQKGWI